MLDEIDSVDSVLDEMDLVDAVDVESRLVDAESVEGCFVVTVIMEFAEFIRGDVLNIVDVWWKVCSVVSTGMLEEIDSDESVLDEIVVDADDVEKRLVDAESVEGCFVVTVIIELVEVIIGGWLDIVDVWWEGAVCIIIAGSSKQFKLFSLI